MEKAKTMEDFENQLYELICNSIEFTLDNKTKKMDILISSDIGSDIIELMYNDYFKVFFKRKSYKEVVAEFTDVNEETFGAGDGHRNGYQSACAWGYITAFSDVTGVDYFNIED